MHKLHVMSFSAAVRRMMAFLVPYKQTQYTELKISIRIQIQFQLQTNVVLVQDNAKKIVQSSRMFLAVSSPFFNYNSWTVREFHQTWYIALSFTPFIKTVPITINVHISQSNNSNGKNISLSSYQSNLIIKQVNSITFFTKGQKNDTQFRNLFLFFFFISK